MIKAFHCTGSQNRLVVSIPEYVAHGYRVLGHFYRTTATYDPNAPERIPFDSPEIGFDWTPRLR